MNYKPPFPWFGGKAKVAPQVWRALGDVDNYVEPFFGSGAVLFGRTQPGKMETVNDLDHFVANFWRAAKNDPEAVAHYADNPVNEDDLTARHIWLVKHGKPELAERIPADPDYYDPKIAGWWVWGLCCWIGSGWCSGVGPWWEEGGRLVKRRGAEGVNRQLVHLGDAGQGVNRPEGVTRQLVHLGNEGKGVNRPDTHLVEYFQAIAERLRSVNVCSGDWSRIVTNGALSYGKTVGVFLDPPYSLDMRDASVYNTDAPDLAVAVTGWCAANGSDKRKRIVLCGYEGEHNSLEKLGWRKEAWKAGRAYGNSNEETDNNANRGMERIWYSPNCIHAQTTMFGVKEEE